MNSKTERGMSSQSSFCMLAADGQRADNAQGMVFGAETTAGTTTTITPPPRNTTTANNSTPR